MVALVSADKAGSIYRAVNSCLMLAPAVAGHEILTVEGLEADGQSNDVQKAMASAGASQCGYCTPGFVISLFAEYYRPNRTGPCETAAMEGNLCRCTGYRPIRDAAVSLGTPPDGPFRTRTSRAAPRLEAVHYQTANGRFERPTKLADCVAIAASDPSIKWISGGTDLAVESNLHFRKWPRLVSLEAIPELHEFSETDERIRIGAALSLTEAERLWTDQPDIVRQWWRLFASPAIRNRATFGGNLATASPIGDGAPMLLALDTVVDVIGPGGRRRIPLASFFKGYRRSALEPGDLIAAIEIPKPFPSFSRFYKVAKRRMDDISTVAAAFSTDLNSSGRIARMRFAFGGVGATPLRAYAAEEAMIGERWSAATVSRAQAVLHNILKPLSDHRGSAKYRVEVAKALIEKFHLEQAA